MAPRRGATQVEEPQLGGLVFNEPLSWRAGKPIPTGELLRRLDALSNELREMDQEKTDKDSLTAVAKELAAQNLINHKDKGVRAFTACCLVDVLEMCAPDAPFTPTQLKAIFTLFITMILPALSDPSNAYNTQHKYVLSSLAEVKSIVLLTDIPGSDPLFLHIFSSFFDTISGSSKASTGESIAKDVVFNMTLILVTLVDESPSLPPEVVDIIMAQFLRAYSGKAKHGDVDEKQLTLLDKDFPEAYNTAKTICNSCPEKMARYVSQYFNDVIMELSGGVQRPANGHRRMSDAAAEESEDESAPVGPTEQDLKELSKAHELLKELWRASPTVLQNVIPQLEAELSAENVQLRLLATETLGDIVSGIGSAGPPPAPPMDPAAYPQATLEEYERMPISQSMLTTPMSPQSFAQTHPGIYQSFLGRKNDKSLVIRSGWTTAIGRILTTSAGGIGLSREEESSLVRGLGEKLNDADEKVRLAAVRAIRQFGFHDIMKKLAPNGSVSKSGSVLCSLADRARDRKHAVRIEGMTTLGRIWGVASGEIAAGNDAVIEALGAIPSRVFDVFYANDKELNVLLDHVMFEQLIPLNYPPTKGKAKATNGDSQTQANGDAPFDADKVRAERILLVVKSLDVRAKKAFFAMQARQTTFSNVLESFLKRCEDFNGGVTDKDAKDVKTKLDAIVKWLGDFLPDPLRTSLDLHKYAKLHDRRSYQLLRFAMDPKSDFSIVYKAIKEFRKRIENAPGAPAGILETLNPLIFRSACLIYNRSHQPVIMQISRTDENGLGATANEVMKEISDKLPQIFQVSVNELCKSLEEQAPSKTKSNDPGSVETLKALASFVKSVDHKIPSDRKFIQALVNFSLYGTPPKAAKYAVTILMAATDRKEMHMKDLLDKSTQGWEYGEDHFITKLATISQLTLLDPRITEDNNDDILDITTQQVLLKTRTTSTEAQKEWQSDAELDEECQAKIWAIKTLVNRLRTTTEPETAKKLAVPVFKLLNALIAKRGELSKNNDTPKHHKSRLRLFAAQQMLKICTIKMFDDLLTPLEFNRLALVAQDEVWNVRRGFIEKLQKYLIKSKLSNRFLAIIFLTAYEPTPDFKTSIMTWIRSRVKIYHESKNRFVESVFPRLLHLLAHHPDYSANPVELLDTAKYILYYIQTVVSEDNLALIYKYAERVKGARNAILGADPDALYVLSDLAQALLKKWEEKKGWSMQTWPAKVGMPVGLFAAMPNHEVAQEVAEKNYLPDDIEDALDALVRNSERKKIPKSKRKATSEGQEDSTPRPSKKIKSSPKPKSIKKERLPKEKKTPKPKRIRKEKEGGETGLESSARRQSMRASAKGNRYVERDDSEDSEEMLEGVASWEYEDGRVLRGSGDEVSGSESEDEAGEGEPMEGVEVEGEERAKSMPSPSLSPAPEEESAEPEIQPPKKKRGRPSNASKAATESAKKPKSTPASSRKTKKVPESSPAPEAEPESEKETSPEAESSLLAVKKGRGRPKKTAISTPASTSRKGKKVIVPEPEVQSDEDSEMAEVPTEEVESEKEFVAVKTKGRKVINKKVGSPVLPRRGKGKKAPEPEPGPASESEKVEESELSEPEEEEVEVEEEVMSEPEPVKAKGRNVKAKGKKIEKSTPASGRKGKGRGKKSVISEEVVGSEDESEKGGEKEVEVESEKEAEAEEEEEPEPVAKKAKTNGKGRQAKAKKAVSPSPAPEPESEAESEPEADVEDEAEAEAEASPPAKKSKKAAGKTKATIVKKGKAKAKAPIRKAKSKEVKGKGKKDVFDLDEDE